MWALPTLSVLNAETLLHQFEGRSLWCLLLFPKADKPILDGLRRNWDRFSQALGPNVHVVTLLEGEDPNSGKSLRFPPGYEASVGKFCHDLKVRIDDLPVLVLLNASDNRGPPCWSLKRDNAALASQALETLVSDICASTFDLSNDLDEEMWRDAAATKFFDTRSARDTVWFLRANGKYLRTLVLSLVKTLKPPTT